MKNSLKVLFISSLFGFSMMSSLSLAGTNNTSNNQFTGVLSAVGTNPPASSNSALFAPYQIRIDNDSNYDLVANVVGTSFSRSIAAGDALSIKNNTAYDSVEIDITENGQQFFDQMVDNYSCVEVHSGVNVQVIENCLQ